MLLPELYYLRAKAFVGLKQFEKANLDIKRAIKLEPDNEIYREFLFNNNIL